MPENNLFSARIAKVGLTPISPLPTPTQSPSPTIPSSPLPTPMQSPGQKGKIYGYVVNISGEPIESVKLRIKGIKTGYNSTTSSDLDGFFEFEELEADAYVLTAKKRGYKPSRQTITLAEGGETEVEITLKRTSRPSPPTIVKGVIFDNENGNPIKGAKITVRGISGSYTTGNKGKFLIELEPGKYTLRIKATGYQTKNTKIKLREGQTLTKNIGLKKSYGGWITELNPSVPCPDC
ncbi:MAG: PEGA domain-containing protein [Planctomycetes bacterium]|nr:PEGA domain-containing protein [Planctomycetota bacterium]